MHSPMKPVLGAHRTVLVLRMNNLGTTVSGL